MNVAEELIKARKCGYALPAFNTNNLEVTKAICNAASNFCRPFLIQTTPGSIEYAGLEQIFNIVNREIKATGVQATVHLDHGKEFLDIVSAIRIGYKSVMFDGSSLPLEENIELTHKVVKFAHQYGVTVEGEIGVIGREEGGKMSGRSVMSTPHQVKDFVHETGVDSIAISIGNEHGAPKDERIDFGLLKRIADEVEIPLVMHGASGLSLSEIKEAVSLGVAKFNIDTNIRRAFTNAIEDSNEKDYREAIKEGMDEVEEVVARYLRLFNNEV